MSATVHPVRRLMLATEGSEHDSGAQAIALGLATRLGLTLSAVMPLTSNPEFESVAPALAARAEADWRSRAEALRAQAAAAGVAIEVLLRRGPEAYEGIVAAAQAAEADLLVIRRRGKRGFLANLLVGEMVTKVVAHATCPVLVCPQAVRSLSGTLLLGVDPLQAQPALVAHAAHLAQQLRVALRVVSVATDGTQRPLADAAVAAAVHEARRLGARADGEARTGRAHEQLIAAARDIGAGAMFIARHGTPGLQRAWMGGVAQKVIGLAACPVWIHVAAARPA